MAMPGRSFNSDAYKYGYQGSEKDNEISGTGNSYTTFFRQLDPRLGRWFSPDPVIQPWQTPYSSMNNNPINLNDVMGDEAGDEETNFPDDSEIEKTVENENGTFDVHVKGQKEPIKNIKKEVLYTYVKHYFDQKSPLTFKEFNDLGGGDANDPIDYKANKNGKQAAFAIRHPHAAVDIGVFVRGSTNISTNAVRFSTRGNVLNEPNDQGNQASQVNAMRHTLWQASIASKYGASTAAQAGNAHEENPKEDLTNRYISGGTRMQNVAKADVIIDLLNNQIGRKLGVENTGLNMLEMSKVVLKHFHENGLYVGVPQKDGSVAIVKQTISTEQYNSLMNFYKTLDQRGFTPEEKAARQEGIEEWREQEIHNMWTGNKL